MNNLILVRHGQSLWNLERRFTGWADINLTEHGKSEAQYAGKLVNETQIEFDTYFTGPNLGPPTQPWEERPLLYNLLNNNFYKKIYTAHIRTIINESLDTSYIRNNINQLQNLAYSAVDQDPYKNFTMSHYFDNTESAIWTGWGFAGIMSTIDARKQYLLSHPEISLLSPSISSVNISVTNNVITVNTTDANIVELMATTSQYNSKFKSFNMYDDGLNGGDLLSNDGIYSAFMPFPNSNNEIKFYIRAQNNDAIMFSPQRAEYEFYIYSNMNTNNIISFSNNKKLVKVIDVLGRHVNDFNNSRDDVLFYIYSDGTVEKIYKIR